MSIFQVCTQNSIARITGTHEKVAYIKSEEPWPISDYVWLFDSLKTA